MVSLSVYLLVVMAIDMCQPSTVKGSSEDRTVNVMVSSGGRENLVFTFDRGDRKFPEPFGWRISFWRDSLTEVVILHGDETAQTRGDKADIPDFVDAEIRITKKKVTAIIHVTNATDAHSGDYTCIIEPDYRSNNSDSLRSWDKEKTLVVVTFSATLQNNTSLIDHLETYTGHISDGPYQGACLAETLVFDKFVDERFRYIYVKAQHASLQVSGVGAQSEDRKKLSNSRLGFIIDTRSQQPYRAPPTLECGIKYGDQEIKAGPFKLKVVRSLAGIKDRSQTTGLFSFERSASTEIGAKCSATIVAFVIAITVALTFNVIN